MSGIGGVYLMSGGSPDGVALDLLSQEIEYRGRDHAGIWQGNGVGLVHRHSWTTPEDQGESQPLVQDGLVLSADARLDNREQLLEQLSTRGSSPGTACSDARLILSVYRQWGAAGLPRLIGDFALALWDGSREELLLARDATGMRPLYYALDSGALYFASSISALRRVAPSRPRLNHPVIWAFLNNDFEPWLTETVLTGIARLPPAHLLCVGRDGIRRQLYYRFGCSSPSAGLPDQHWVEGFRHVLDLALLARCRSSTPVTMMVSGGLDSSSLACSAQARAPEIGAQIRLHTAVYHRTPQADEWKYFQAVAGNCRDFPAVSVPADEWWALREKGPEGGFPLDEPELSMLRCHSLGLFRSAASRGSRVVITGEGANQLLCHGVYSAAPLLRATGWPDFLPEARYFRKVSGAPWPKLLFYFSEPRLPQWVTGFLRRRWGGRPVVMPWLRSPCPQPLGPGPEPLSKDYWRPAQAGVLGRVAYQLFRGAFDSARFQALDLLAAHAGVEWRAPFLDRRVVEFMLQVPDRLFARRGENRLLLRKSMLGRLPELVRRRPDKSYLAELHHRGFRERERAELESLLKEPLVGRLPYVEVSQLRRHIESYWRREFDDHSYFQRPLALEVWLRSVPDLLE